mgnify:CR=1 FL=1
MSTGELVPTLLEVGKNKPRKHGLKKHSKPRKKNLLPQLSLGQPEQQVASTINPLLKANAPAGTLSNLVVMVRFADHANRSLPSKSEINILFNQTGGHSTFH